MAFTGDCAETLRTETENLNISGRTTGSRSPAGPRRLRDSDTHKRIAVPKALCVLRERPPTKAQKRQSLPFYPLATQGFRNVRNAPRVVIPPPPKTPPVTPCVPLCAIFLRKPSVYPLSLVKANVGRLCEKLNNAMKSGLGQRCDGNFWAIFAGTVLDEKPNFTGGFFEWRRPFDFSTR